MGIIALNYHKSDRFVYFYLKMFFIVYWHYVISVLCAKLQSWGAVGCSATFGQHQVTSGLNGRAVDLWFVCPAVERWCQAAWPSWRTQIRTGVERYVSGVGTSSWATWTHLKKLQRLLTRTAGCTLEIWEDMTSMAFCTSREGSRVSCSQKSLFAFSDKWLLEALLVWNMDLYMFTHLCQLFWCLVETKMWAFRTSRVSGGQYQITFIQFFNVCRPYLSIFQYFLALPFYATWYFNSHFRAKYCTFYSTTFIW